MSASRGQFGFLLDNNCPDSIRAFLSDRGHRAYLVREEMADNTPDQLVADFAIRNVLVLVTFDKDFHQQQYLKPRYDGLMRLQLAVPKSSGLQRLGQQIERLEHELSIHPAGERFTFMISRDKIMIYC